jgi:hypothetical protein
VQPRAPLTLRAITLDKNPSLWTGTRCAAIGTCWKMSLMGNLSTVDVEYSVIFIEGYIEDETVQLV